MKHRIIYIGIIVLFLATLTVSCNKDDLNLNADGDDVTIVYGLLNHDEKDHYLKIYKSYQTKENAEEAAADGKNIYYGADELTVYIYPNDNPDAKIYFNPVTENNKDSGLFAYPAQTLYKATATIAQGTVYNLVVENHTTGKSITATAKTLSPITVKTITVASSHLISFPNKNNAIEIVHTDRARLYGLEFDFYYHERNSYTGEVNTPAPIVWNAALTKDPSSATINLTYNGNEFYRYVANRIEQKDESVKRYTDSVLVKIWVAGEDLAMNIDLSSATLSAVDERTLYSNIKGGLGLFSTRYCWQANCNMTESSKKELRENAATAKLNFVD